MTDIASLAFGIDTSDVRRGSTDLDGLSQSSERLARSQDGATAAHARFLAETANLIQRTAQMRAQFEQTSASLDGLLTKLDAARQSMNQGADSFASFASARSQVEALGAAYGQTSTQLELYNQRAVQVGLNSQQTVLSLQRITDAMSAQTAAGQAIRQTMLDYGVSLQALTGGNAAAALQAFTDKIKTVSDSAIKFRQVQSVLGPIDAGTYASLNNQDYVPQQTLRQRAYSAQVNQTAANITTNVAQAAKQDQDRQAQLADLQRKYLGFGSGTYQLGEADQRRIAQALGPGNAFSQDGQRSNAGQLELFRYLENNPKDPSLNTLRNREALQSYNFWTGPSWFTDPSVRAARQAQINQQYTQESDRSTGFLGSGYGPSLGTSSFLPYISSVGRSLLNSVYSTEREPFFIEPKNQDPAERDQADTTAADLISKYGFGDFGLQRTVDARSLLRGSYGADVAQNFAAQLGPQEGPRALSNIQLQLLRQQTTAGNPGQSQIDQNSIEAWILAQPREQHGQARALVDWTRQNARDVDVGSWARNGLTFQGIQSGQYPIGLSQIGAPDGKNLPAFNQAFSGQVRNYATSADQDFTQQIERQRQLTTAQSDGAAAVETLTTRWEAYDAALSKTKSSEEAYRQSQQALLELEERRATASQKLVSGLERQNLNQYRVITRVNAAGSDPAARTAAAAQAQIENDYGTAVTDQGFNRGRAAYVGPRATALGQGAISSASDLAASSQHELDNQRALLSVATQRADVQAKMARDQGVNDQFSKALGEAQAADNLNGTHIADSIQAAIDKTKDLKDALSQVNAEAALFKLGNDLGQGNENEAYIQGLPRAQQGAARARLQVLQPFQSGALSGGPYSPGNDAGSSGATGIIPSSDRLSMAQTAVSGTPIPPELLLALVSQESSWNTNEPNGGLGQILPSTALSPGFNMQGVNPSSLRAPGANLQFTAQYLAARGAALGMTASDWRDPTKVANVLQAYNGGGDPNYVQHVERYLPGGYFSSAPGSASGALGAALGPGAVVPYGTALNSAVADPAGRNALNAADRGYQLQISGQVQTLQAGASQQQAANAAALPLLAAGQTGLAQYARAGAIGNNPDTLDPLRASLAQQSVIRSQQEDFAGQVGGLNQSSANNEGLAQAYSQGQQAVDAYNEAIKAQAIVMRDGAAAAQDNTMKNQALAAVQKNAASQQDLLASQKSATDQEAIDRNIYQAGLGIGSQQKIAQQMNSYDTEAFINKNLSQASPEAQQQYRNNQSALVLSQQQVQDQQRMQGALNQAGDAVANSFASAIVSGRNLHSVFASLLDDLAQIAIKAVITKPITNAIDGFGSSLFGGSNTALSAGDAALNMAGSSGLSGFFGNLFGNSTPPLLTNAPDIGAGAAAALSPGAALALTGSAFGNVFSRGMIQPFASGGVINSPTTWMMANGDVALAGEAGAEAIMPLKRLPNGNLGVQTGGGGASSVQVNTPITINNGPGGGGQMDAKTLMQIQMQIERSARTAVKGVIADERRPGGDLYS